MRLVGDTWDTQSTVGEKRVFVHIGLMSNARTAAIFAAAPLKDERFIKFGRCVVRGGALMILALMALLCTCEREML